jgi:hypothetical protein
MSYARKVDATHASIRHALRACGCEVKDVSHFPGFVDLLVIKRGRLHLVEAKTPQNKSGRIEKTKAQLELEQRGFSIVYISSVEQAIAWATTKGE